MSVFGDVYKPVFGQVFGADTVAILTGIGLDYSAGRSRLAHYQAGEARLTHFSQGRSRLLHYSQASPHR